VATSLDRAISTAIGQAHSGRGALSPIRKRVATIIGESASGTAYGHGLPIGGYNQVVRQVRIDQSRAAGTERVIDDLAARVKQYSGMDVGELTSLRGQAQENQGGDQLEPVAGPDLASIQGLPGFTAARIDSADATGPVSGAGQATSESAEVVSVERVVLPMSVESLERLVRDLRGRPSANAEESADRVPSRRRIASRCSWLSRGRCVQVTRGCRRESPAMCMAAWRCRIRWTTR